MGAQSRPGDIVWRVKGNPLLEAPQRWITRDDLNGLIRRLADNLVAIEDPTGEFLLHLDDGRVIDTKGWDGWEWTHGIGLYGLWEYYAQTGEQAIRHLIEAWFDRHLAQGTTKNVNTMAVFLTAACLYEDGGDRRLAPWLEAWADWVMRIMPRTQHGGLQHITLAEENREQLWDDTLMMTVIPLTKIGLVLGRRDYVDEAIFQFLTHVTYLLDRDSGLWFHGWTFEGGHNFARARWARGNSWVTMVIPEFLALAGDAVPRSVRRYLTEILIAQVCALVRYQDASGMWHTLIDDPNSYLETSATAGFAYGILKAIRTGLLGEEYFATADKAVRAVTAHIDVTGELCQVSFGTGMGQNLQFYRDIPLTSMPYGQAMAILCLQEYLRIYY